METGHDVLKKTASAVVKLLLRDTTSVLFSSISSVFYISRRRTLFSLWCQIMMPRSLEIQALRLQDHISADGDGDHGFNLSLDFVFTLCG